MTTPCYTVTSALFSREELHRSSLNSAILHSPELHANTTKQHESERKRERESKWQKVYIKNYKKLKRSFRASREKKYKITFRQRSGGKLFWAVAERRGPHRMPEQKCWGFQVSFWGFSSMINWRATSCVMTTMRWQLNCLETFHVFNDLYIMIYIYMCF